MNDLKSLTEIIIQHFPKFGVNKQQTIKRLVYEIAKRENQSISQTIDAIPKTLVNFDTVKNWLLIRRYPNLSEKERRATEPFPALEIKPQDEVVLNSESFFFQPEEIYIEEKARDLPLTKRITTIFKNVPIFFIKSYKKHVESLNFSISQYNQRAKKLFIVNEQFNFITACPCTKDCVCCNYYICNLGMGCSYECEYCYLQSYTNAPGIILPANIDDFLNQLTQFKKPVRIGTGQFTDSLIFDPITEYSRTIVEFLRNKPHIQFEFKTKSVNIDNFFRIQAAKNIIIGWSINPQDLITECEHLTMPLTARLRAAQKCTEYGYKVAFHFDPIIKTPNWQSLYGDVIDQIFQTIHPEFIAWISLGTLRMTLKQKQTIETRFPKNTILDEEFLPGFDKKLRYNESTRKEIYTTLYQKIRSYSATVPTYLCMENNKMFQECQIPISSF